MKKYIKPNIKVVVLNEALAANVTSDQTKNPPDSNAKDNTTESTPVSVSSNSKSIWEN